MTNGTTNHREEVFKALDLTHRGTLIAKALKGADMLGVASIEEGLTLREAGITQPIVLIEGLFYPDEIELAAKHEFTLVVHHLPHVEML